MMKIWINRLGCVLLLAASAAVSAQDREIGPLPSLAPLVEDVAPAVVNIAVTGTVSAPIIEDDFFRRFFGDQFGDQFGDRPLRGEGSGVIVDAREGYLLTNHHVIENADEIVVTLADGRRFDATVVGSDADSDVAVLKIDGNDLTAIAFAENDDLRVGDYVVAIGNPLGFENTVTSGIVSGLGRSGVNRDPNDTSYQDFIQTDASINVGNSGGALVNLRGELVGINSAIISQTGGNIGIGLAIPTDMAVGVMDQLIEFGEVRRGFLGVRMQTITQDLAEEWDLSVSSGAMVTEVTENSAAEAAGIQTGDVLVGVDDEPITSGNELRNSIGLMRPGEEVEIALVRNGSRLTLNAVLGLRPDSQQMAEEAGEAIQQATDPIIEGVMLAETQLDGIAGLSVVAISEDSLAAMQGLRQGDLITGINRRRVRTLAEARAIIEGANAILVQIRRGNRDLLLQLR